MEPNNSFVQIQAPDDYLSNPNFYTYDITNGDNSINSFPDINKNIYTIEQNKILKNESEVERLIENNNDSGFRFGFIDESTEAGESKFLNLFPTHKSKCITSDNNEQILSPNVSNTEQLILEEDDDQNSGYNSDNQNDVSYSGYNSDNQSAVSYFVGTKYVRDIISSQNPGEYHLYSEMKSRAKDSILKVTNPRQAKFYFAGTILDEDNDGILSVQMGSVIAENKICLALCFQNNCSNNESNQMLSLILVDKDWFLFNASNISSKSIYDLDNDLKTQIENSDASSPILSIIKIEDKYFYPNDHNETFATFPPNYSELRPIYDSMYKQQLEIIDAYDDSLTSLVKLLRASIDTEIVLKHVGIELLPKQIPCADLINTSIPNIIKNIVGSETSPETNYFQENGVDTSIGSNLVDHHSTIPILASASNSIIYDKTVPTEDVGTKAASDIPIKDDNEIECEIQVAKTVNPNSRKNSRLLKDLNNCGGINFNNNNKKKIAAIIVNEPPKETISKKKIPKPSNTKNSKNSMANKTNSTANKRGAGKENAKAKNASVVEKNNNITPAPTTKRKYSRKSKTTEPNQDGGKSRQSRVAKKSEIIVQPITNNDSQINSFKKSVQQLVSTHHITPVPPPSLNKVTQSHTEVSTAPKTLIAIGVQHQNNENINPNVTKQQFIPQSTAGKKFSYSELVDRTEIPVASKETATNQDNLELLQRQLAEKDSQMKELLARVSVLEKRKEIQDDAETGGHKSALRNLNASNSTYEAVQFSNGRRDENMRQDNINNNQNNCSNPMIYEMNGVRYTYLNGVKVIVENESNNDRDRKFFDNRENFHHNNNTMTPQGNFISNGGSACNNMFPQQYNTESLIQSLPPNAGLNQQHFNYQSFLSPSNNYPQQQLYYPTPQHQYMTHQSGSNMYVPYNNNQGPQQRTHQNNELSSMVVGLGLGSMMNNRNLY